MNTSSLCAIAAAAVVLASCEIPRSPSTPSPSTPTLAPTPTPLSQPAEVKPTQQPIWQQDTRSVDGRRAAPLANIGDVRLSHQPKVYSYGALPAPTRPKPGSVSIAATPEIANEVAASKTAVESPIVVMPQRPVVERYLIGKGVDVLDRSSLESLQSEHFIQRAAVAKRDFETWSRANNVGQQKSNHATVVGRDAARVHGAGLWWLAADAKPLLNGGALAEAAKLPAGQMRSARSILLVSETAYSTRELSKLGKRPAADSIPFTPSIRSAGPESLPQGQAGEWEADASDSFHYVSNDGPIYFDAERRVFWRVSDAWVGREVTRQEYLQARSQPLDDVCPQCGHVHRRSNPNLPVAAEHPEQWQCPECKDKMSVQYLDGYQHPSSTAPRQLIVQARQAKVVPGIYPVASSKTPNGNLMAGACIGGEAPEKAAVASRLRKLGVLPVPDAWCWLEADGSCLVITAQEWSQLRQNLEAPGWPLPLVDRVGNQEFRLLSQTHDAAMVSVPVERAEVDVRITSVATGELLVVGTVAVDYLNLLTRSVDLPIYKSGPQLQGWPTTEQQRELLGKELARRIADLAVR